jgi:hypothetical protein
MQAKHLLIFLVFLTISAHAQIKLFPAGKTTIGTIITHAALQHRIEGSTAFTSSGSDVFRILSNGSLHVGTGTTGNELLTLNGTSNPALKIVSQAGTNAYAHFNNVTNGWAKAFAVIQGGSDKFMVYGWGQVWAYEYKLYSDSTLKTNITPLTNTLSKLLQLNGYRYNYKSSLFVGTTNLTPITSKYRIGLIAQEVEKVFPELVETNDSGIKGVSYEAMIPILLEAIKEQQAKINQLEQKINACCKIGN